MNYKKIIAKLTLEEKASLLTGKNFWKTLNIDRLDIPSMFLADGPNGLRKQAAAADHLGLNESIKSTCFPTSGTLANSWNEELIYQVGKAIGKEARDEEVGVLLGPGTNIKRNPRGGRNFEYYSEDPYLAGKLSASFVKGAQSEGIATTVKHFAVNNQEYRRMSIDSVVDERALREIYLMPFEITVKEGQSKGVMAAYNLVNGVYANENNHLINEILRKEWGFQGMVVSDWGGMNDRVKSLCAGAELEMPYSGTANAEEVIKAIKEGQLKEEILDEAVDRILSLVFETSEQFKKPETKFDIEKHHAIAKLGAEESIVLLKNEKNILPLRKGQKIALIGDFAREQRIQGAGSSGVNPTKQDSVLEYIREFDLNIVGFEQGFHRYGKKKPALAKKALQLAKQAEVVVLFVGLDEYSETEGLDRENIFLPKNQLDLIHQVSQVNPNLVIVLSCGSVIDLSFEDRVLGLIHAYLPGQAGAKALVEILLGKVNPSAKLSESYPLHYQDVSSAKYFPGIENTVEYRESIFVGYRYLDSKNILVKYPFGYGLSYTSFAYSNLVIEEDKVKFILKNIGKIAGKEIAQLYIGKKDSQVLRAKKELKGFIKVALKPGESKEVEILFNEYSFRFFNVKDQKFVVEPGEYEVYIGSSLIDIHLDGSLKLEGVAINYPYALKDLPSYQKLDIENIPDQEFALLLGRDIPNPHFKFYKKRRMVVEYNTTIQQLRYARGWLGRFFAWGIRVGYRFMVMTGNKKTANVMQMGLFHSPMRNLSRMSNGGISFGQLDGLIMAFNGKFFKGLGKFFREGKIAKNKKRLKHRRKL